MKNNYLIQINVNMIHALFNYLENANFLIFFLFILIFIFVGINILCLKSCDQPRFVTV